MVLMLEIREILINYFKKHEANVLFVLKFLLGVLIYLFVFQIGYAAPMFNVITTSWVQFPYIIFMGLLFAVIPLEFNYALFIFNITIQFSSKIEVAAIVFMVLMLVFCFYAHLGTRESGLLIGLFFAFYFNMPYIIPIFAGIYLGLASVIPILLGTVLWYLRPLALELAQGVETAGASVMDMPLVLSEIYITMTAYFNMSDEIAVTSFVLILVFLVVYIVSRLDIDYRNETAVMTGSAASIIFFIAAMVFTNYSTNIFALFIFSILSGIIVLLIRFFDNVLDYKRAERVEFEDEDYYYYVQLIPKVSAVSRKKRTVGRVQRVSRNMDIHKNNYENSGYGYDNNTYEEDEYDYDNNYDQYYNDYDDSEEDLYDDYGHDSSFRDDYPDNQ